MQEYFTALEIAEAAKRLNVASVPHTKRGVAKLADNEGWSQSGNTRQRKGYGGGIEYHFSLFPEFLVSALIADDQKRQLLLESRKAEEERKKALSQLGTDALTTSQRQVMEARSAVLQQIAFDQIQCGITQSKAVDAFVERCQSDPSLKKLAQAANDRAGKSRIISRPQIYRWFKNQKEGGLEGLAPKSGRSTHSFPSWFPLFMNYYARPQKPTITEAFEQFRYHERINENVNYDQVRRLLKKLKKVEGTQAIHRGREGALALKARHAYVLRDTSGLLPTSVYTADGKTFDAEVLHPIHGQPFRPEITSMVDVATRKCVGWSIGLDESANVVMDALRVACERHGIPAIFYVDRGPGYKNDRLDNELTGFCARLGVTKMHSLPYNSQARGIIERFNGSVYTPLAKTFSSYIGKDMDRQAGQLAHKRSRKELKETGGTRVLPTWQEFMAAMGEAIEAYNNLQHSGLTIKGRSGRKRKVSPNIAWADAVEEGFEALLVSQDESDDLFRPYARRRTNRAMVSWNTNSYFHLDLEPYDGTDILVGYDIHDASKVWCREIDKSMGEEAPGRLICVAEFEGNKTRYVPLSVEQAAIEKRAKGRLRRVYKKRDEIIAEASPHRFLTQSAQPIVHTIPIQEHSPGISLATGENAGDGCAAISPSPAPSKSKPRVNANGRPFFTDDHELAIWLLENPSKMTETDRSLMRSIMNAASDREYLRINGVDLNELRNLIQKRA